MTTLGCWTVRLPRLPCSGVDKLVLGVVCGDVAVEVHRLGGWRTVLMVYGDRSNFPLIVNICMRTTDACRVVQT